MQPVSTGNRLGLGISNCRPAKDVAAGVRFVYASARLEVTPVQTRVPIFFAAMGPQMLRLAGAVADGVLLNVGASVEYVQWAVGQIHAGAEAAGRDASDVTIAAWLTA